MIAEGVVLFGIQHFEQGGLGISAEVGANLVDLVKDNDRVPGTRMTQGLDDAARHGSYVGAPVAAYFRLVVHAAK